MILEFLQIWLIGLIVLVITSLVTTVFILVSTGIIQDMHPNEKGELRSFSLIVMGAWNIGLSLILAQVIFLFF